jgi:hypothetical protein
MRVTDEWMVTGIDSKGNPGRMVIHHQPEDGFAAVAAHAAETAAISWGDSAQVVSVVNQADSREITVDPRVYYALEEQVKALHQELRDLRGRIQGDLHASAQSHEHLYNVYKLRLEAE